MVTSKNIIKKVLLEVETSSMSTALQIKDEIGSYFKENIDPIISRSFEKFAPLTKNNVVRIDKITLDLNVNSRYFYSELEAKIMAGIRIKIDELSSEKVDDFELLNRQENATKTLQYFIENGALPWWSNSEEIINENSIIEALNSPIFVKTLQSSFKKTNTLHRFILNYDNQLLKTTFIKFLDKPKSTKLLNNDTFLLLDSKDSKIIFWSNIFAYIRSKSVENFYTGFGVFMKSKFSSKNDALAIPSTLSKSLLLLIEFCNENFKIPLAFKSTSSPSSNQSSSKKFTLEILESHQAAISKNKKLASKFTSEEIYIVLNEEDPKNVITDSPESEIEVIESEPELSEGSIIKNAGLVILHPFLQKFFENQKLLNGKNIAKEKIDLAVHLLHYIGCKGEHAYEFDLIMEKYLCDVPISYPINRFITLSDDQKQACDDLLMAVLNHWEALKTENTDALRGEFLSREGKLSLKNSRETLYIERKTQDILLDKLPWNMSIIKFPWKSKIIFVDW